MIVYYPVAGFCGIDNSFLGKDQVVLSTFRVHIPDAYSTVHTSIKALQYWQGKPLIAVWEEAWFENWLRLPSEDAHIALVRVDP